jgi:cyclin-dependent kinase 7
MKLNPEFKDGIAMDALREMRHLQELEHPNIIKLHDIYTTKEQNISLVLEHLPRGDLEQLWKDSTIMYGGADIKSWSNMLCRAVWFCHENRVLHRDIKGNNLLIAADNTLKLADFGLARSMADPGRLMSYNVITRFYRPPELFLGSRHYGGCVDIWSVACVMAELAKRDFFIPSQTDIEHISKITDIFGIPTEQDWPGISKLSFWEVSFKAAAPTRPKPLSWWRQELPLLGDDGIDLLRGMMVMNPAKRLNAVQVLQHPYWRNYPVPTEKEKLPKRGEDEKRMAEDLKRVGGEMDTGRADKVARKLF